MITLKCPKGHTRQVPEALAGHTVSCFQCPHTWKVPGSAAGVKKAQTKAIADRVMDAMKKGAAKPPAKPAARKPKDEEE
ncbi:MAG TPA: hypothetical protein VHF22_13070 [Planctomycetota bacterium]|nr:hypothetical protein [Planctomycetota bacterium]